MKKLLVSMLASLASLYAYASHAAVETRSYAISYFGMATYSYEGDCSGGVHPEVEEIYLLYAEQLGASSEQIDTWRQKMMRGEAVDDLDVMMKLRGRIDGKPVNPFAHPAAVVDLQLPGLDGKYAYGFDLDGSGPDDPDGFEDPETHQAGVDHQMYRALGCSPLFRGTLENLPTHEAWAWGNTHRQQPAWLLTVSGQDLSKDGPVTIGFHRALEHLSVNSDGSIRADMAYRIEPDPRSTNTFQGELKDGVVTITEHSRMLLVRNPMQSPEFNLSNVHLRLTLNPDGTARGFLGGYQPWREIYWGFASVGFDGEVNVVGDVTGYYHLLKRYADADPDPVSGQNRLISGTFYLEAIPAFVAPVAELGSSSSGN